MLPKAICSAVGYDSRLRFPCISIAKVSWRLSLCMAMSSVSGWRITQDISPYIGTELPFLRADFPRKKTKETVSSPSYGSKFALRLQIFTSFFEFRCPTRCSISKRARNRLFIPCFGLKIGILAYIVYEKFLRNHVRLHLSILIIYIFM